MYIKHFITYTLNRFRPKSEETLRDLWLQYGGRLRLNQGPDGSNALEVCAAIYTLKGLLDVPVPYDMLRDWYVSTKIESLNEVIDALEHIASSLEKGQRFPKIRVSSIESREVRVTELLLNEDVYPDLSRRLESLKRILDNYSTHYTPSGFSYKIQPYIITLADLLLILGEIINEESNYY